MNCRHCNSSLSLSFIDLGSAPPSNSYLTEEALRAPEKWYPLRVFVCTDCWLVQTEDYAHFSELFSSEYAYFSSFSSTWLRHAEQYVKTMVERYSLDAKSMVVEVASNDGYLLQFVKARGIPCVGVEPTANTATAARSKGIKVVDEFFGVGLARRLVEDGMSADLIVANNVLAHVPDINEFVTGFALLLKPDGIATFEFPHLQRLVRESQFDTVYHEHFSYLSLTSVRRIFERNGLAIFDTEEIPTHGGSLRIYAQRGDTGRREEGGRVRALLEREASDGMATASFYSGFQARANCVKDDFLAFLVEAKRAGRTVAGYGAAAKGNTLLNYAGIRSDLLGYVVDRNPAKQGKYLPGSRIPIVTEESLKMHRPDYIAILPWNIRDEVIDQLSYVRSWGAQFVLAIPKLELA